MKNLMLGTALLTVIALPAAGQDVFRTQMDPVAITASNFIGKRVYAAEVAVDATEYSGVQEGWNDIGEINDVVLTREGKVDSVLIDIGGFLGMGERQVALGMESIRFVSDTATPEDLNDFFLVVTADKVVLESAPIFERSDVTPMDGATTTADSSATDPAMADGSATDPAMADGSATDPAMADTTEGTLRSVDGYAAVDIVGMTTEKLIGARVYGPDDTDVGEVSEVKLDGQGAASQVILDVGGFLGLGEKPVALDLSSLDVMQATSDGSVRLYTKLTQDELKSLPKATK